MKEDRLKNKNFKKNPNNNINFELVMPTGMESSGSEPLAGSDVQP